jgi:hypothetical protein
MRFPPQYLITLTVLTWESEAFDASLADTLSFVNREQLVGINDFVAWVEITKGQ